MNNVMLIYIYIYRCIVLRSSFKQSICTGYEIALHLILLAKHSEFLFYINFGFILLKFTTYLLLLYLYSLIYHLYFFTKAYFTFNRDNL